MVTAQQPNSIHKQVLFPRHNNPIWDDTTGISLTAGCACQLLGKSNQHMAYEGDPRVSQRWATGGNPVMAGKVQIRPCVCKDNGSAKYGLWAQGGPPATFVHEVVLDTATPIQLYIVSSCFCTRLSGALRTETGRPPKPKILPVWTFTESVLSPA